MRTKTFMMCIVLYALLCQSAFNYSSATGKANKVYTPRLGTTERKAILKTLHASYKRRFPRKDNGRSIYYIVQHLKVYRNWAWIETQPRRNGKNLENAPCAALLQKKNGRWTAIETWLLEEPGIDRAVIKSHHSDALHEIFPAPRHS